MPVSGASSEACGILLSILRQSVLMPVVAGRLSQNLPRFRLTTMTSHVKFDWTSRCLDVAWIVWQSWWSRRKEIIPCLAFSRNQHVVPRAVLLGR